MFVPDIIRYQVRPYPRKIIMQTRRTVLQEILLSHIDFYLTQHNPPAASNANFFEHQRAARGKAGRERAARYQHMIEHAEDDYSLAHGVLNDVTNVHGYGAVNLHGSTNLRRLMLAGLCEYFNITMERIEKRAKFQHFLDSRNARGAAGRHFIPLLNLEYAAVVLVRHAMTKMHVPKEMKTIYRA
jgi:hypothetical protein